MNADGRWTIDELLARYELEPQLFDVFVEGTFDKDVLTQAFSDIVPEKTFYPIDAVDIDAGLLAKHGLTLGNRQRVVVLARELDAVLKEGNVLCLVDRDLDHKFGELETSRFLRWTVFCTIENHFLTEEIVGEILVKAGRAKIKDLREFMRSLSLVLKGLFAMRLIDRDLNLLLRWLPIRKYIVKEQNCINFDNTKFGLALLQANSRTDIKDEFWEKHEKRLAGLTGDVRLEARGHDFTEILAWAISAFNGEKVLDETTAIERMFVLIADKIPTLKNELV